MRKLSPAERAAWQYLAEAEAIVHEAREHLIRVTNLEHARRSGRLRLVSREPRPTLAVERRP
jgi:hypothetical protein